MPFKISSFTPRHGLFLAPMAGFSDYAMRKLCFDHGAEFTVTEMVSAKAVVYRDRKTAALARIYEDEAPASLQLFGKEPSVMSEAAGIMLESSPAEGCKRPLGIDVNMGCPVNKIFSNGEGSALMRSPELIYDILRAMREAVSCPLSAKLRLGVDDAHINVTECALAAEEAGVDFITVHGRTRTQMYSGKCDIEAIANVKNALHIPLIANGDITDAESALNMISTTKCDAIMIGRAAVGNPFIFGEIAAALEGRAYTPPTLAERQSTALRQLSLAIADKGESRAVAEARGSIALYFKGYSGAAALRAKINSATSFAEIEKYITELSDR